MRPEVREKVLELGARAGRGVASFVCELWATVRPELEIEAAVPAAPLLTARDVAARLNTNVQTIYRLAREGKLPAVQTGGRAKRWTEDVVNEFIRRGGVAEQGGQPLSKPLRVLSGGR